LISRNNDISNYPIKAIREQFPALKRIYNNKQVIYFDGPSGSQMVRSSIDAIMKYMCNGCANLHGNYPTSIETEKHLLEARQAIADLVGAKSEEVAFGPNTTTLAFSVSRALSRIWKKGDEIVVTELDHRANVDPWRLAAEVKEATIRWIKLDMEKFTLKMDDLEEIINRNTKVVAVGLASNGVGTINDVKTIASLAKEVGAIVAVDAVHAAPHILIDRDELSADILFLSGYKFFGPYIGFAVIKKDLFKTLRPYKVTASPEYIPDNLETGTQNHAALAGIKPVIDFIASLGEGTTRRDKIINAYKKIESYENYLAGKIRNALKQMPKIILLQAPDSVPKTPTISFRVKGISPAEVCKYLCNNHSIFLGDGHFYAQTIGDILDLNRLGGWVRAGLAPYNTKEEVLRFIQGLKELINYSK